MYIPMSSNFTRFLPLRPSQTASLLQGTYQQGHAKPPGVQAKAEDQEPDSSHKGVPTPYTPVRYLRELSALGTPRARVVALVAMTCGIRTSHKGQFQSTKATITIRTAAFQPKDSLEPIDSKQHRPQKILLSHAVSIFFAQKPPA